MAGKLAKVAEDSARSGFFLISGTALSTVILGIGSILTGRFLGPELYGQYTLALVIPTLLLTFTDLGISQGITKFTASLKAKDETERLARIVKYELLIKALAGIVTIPEIQMARHVTQEMPLLRLFAKPLLKYEENILHKTANKQRKDQQSSKSMRETS